jgi:DNA-binding MarR family transcriptional regulator/GNAT superfamily N-acetyltransferase
MEDAIAAVRQFNRFFTQFVGALDANFLDSGLSLAEARILFEVAQREPCFADDLQTSLDLDAGFVSRVLGRFEHREWINRVKSGQDGRRRSIRLTRSGREEFKKLDGRQRDEVEAVLRRLDNPSRRRLIASIEVARNLLEAKQNSPSFSLHPFRPGDMGLIASRQSILYREHYGWNANIEVNVSEVATAFLRNFKPGREQCWVAEVDGKLAGSVFLTDEGNGASRLRLLYVEPVFQGLGIGDALVSTCIAFARSAGYIRITLWTHSILETARRIYARHGFKLIEAAEHASFGIPLMGETWELILTPLPAESDATPSGRERGEVDQANAHLDSQMQVIPSCSNAG